jgi:hypothetical protein
MGRLQVALLITDNTRAQDIRDVATDVLRLRDKLIEYQGPMDLTAEQRDLESLLVAFSKGQTYAAIAKEENKWIGHYLRLYMLSEDMATAANILTKKERENYCKQHGYYEAGFRLSLWGFTDVEITEILNNGIERIRNHLKPFPPNEPIAAYKTRENLRAWKNGKMHKEIVALAKRGGKNLS